MHEKLDEWLKEGIITPVEEPTDWVSSLAYSRKANGKLRICLDPKDLYSDQEGPLQDPYCGRDHPRVGWQQEVHQVGWNFIIPLHHPRLRVITPHHIQHAVGKIQVYTPAIWTRLLSGHLSANDGPDPRAL